ncbi:MAG: HEAT repeat domain-containing protein [Promethearchaeota archaeon]
MIDAEERLLNAITRVDYSASSQIIDQALKDGRLPDLVREIEAIEGVPNYSSLELRDHVFYYLRMWDIYFAVQIPSRKIIRILDAQGVQRNASVFMVEFIRNLLENRDNRFDQFCANIQTISKGHYAVLIPSILEQRMEELIHCEIQFNSGPPQQYCTAELLRTYYGWKIVNAVHENRYFDIVVDEKQFSMIRDSLEASGINVDAMLVELDSSEWSQHVERRRSRHTSINDDSSSSAHNSSTDHWKSPYENSRELGILHRVKSARTIIYRNDFHQQTSALSTIIASKTQLCNDILMDIASDPSHPMRNRAIQALGYSGDSIALEFLGNIMKNGAQDSVRNVAIRAYSSLASKIAGLGFVAPPPATTPLVVDIAKINSLLNDMIINNVPSSILEDTLQSVASQAGAGATEILLQLFARPQERIRFALVKATRFLDKPSAAPIIRAALKDESEEVVRLAEDELDTRWPDEVWSK